MDTMDHALYVSVAQWIVVSGLVSGPRFLRHDAHPRLEKCYRILEAEAGISGAEEKDLDINRKAKLAYEYEQRGLSLTTR